MQQMGERAEARAREVERQEGNDEEDEEERQKLIKQDEFATCASAGPAGRTDRERPTGDARTRWAGSFSGRARELRAIV